MGQLKDDAKYDYYDTMHGQKTNNDANHSHNLNGNNNTGQGKKHENNRDEIIKGVLCQMGCIISMMGSLESAIWQGRAGQNEQGMAKIIHTQLKSIYQEIMSTRSQDAYHSSVLTGSYGNEQQEDKNNHDDVITGVLCQMGCIVSMMGSLESAIRQSRAGHNEQGMAKIILTQLKSIHQELMSTRSTSTE
jgi:hypothetical protein